jgi:hypothetical protein
MKKFDMTFEEFATSWKQTEVPELSDQEILKMTRGYTESYRRKMWQRLANEVLLGFCFIQVIDLMAHLAGAPMWLKYSFYISTVAYIATDFLGYNWQTNLGSCSSVKDGLRKFFVRMRTLEVLSRLVSAMVGTAAVVVLGLRFASLEGRLVAWILMAPAVVVLMWLSSRRWTRRREETEDLLRQFNEAEDVAPL